MSQGQQTGLAVCTNWNSDELSNAGRVKVWSKVSQTAQSPYPRATHELVLEARRPQIMHSTPD